MAHVPPLHDTRPDRILRKQGLPENGDSRPTKGACEVAIAFQTSSRFWRNRGDGLCLGHGQGPRGLAGLPSDSTCRFRKDERRKGTDAKVHRLATRGHIDREHDHVVRRLEVDVAEFPRRFDLSASLSFRPAERLALVLAQLALVALEFLKVADARPRASPCRLAARLPASPERSLWTTCSAR